MTINVKYIPTNYGVQFVYSGMLGARMWLYDQEALWYKTLGRYCPHLNLGASECSDCGLVLEGDDA